MLTLPCALMSSVSTNVVLLLILMRSSMAAPLAAAARSKQSVQRLEERRLARAVRSDHGDHLAEWYVDRHAVQHVFVTVAGADVAHREYDVAIGHGDSTMARCSTVRSPR